MSRNVHDRWATFLAQQGFAIKTELGAARAFAPSLAPEPALDVAGSWCVDLNHFCALRLVGADASSFLQGYLTCDLDGLDTSHALLGAYCNIKGRVVTDAIVVLTDGHPTLLLHGSLREPVVAGLKKYLAFARSRFATSDEAPVLLGIINPPPHPEFPVAPLSVTAFRSGYSIAIPGPLPRIMLILPHADAAALWLEYAARSQTGDATSWDLMDIRAGTAHVYAATSETFLPQMLNYDQRGAVSFTKGCYLGQEIVARTQHLGRLKRHLHTLQWRGASAPAVGTTLERPDHGRAGTLVGIAACGIGYGEALAVLNDDAGSTLLAAGATFSAINSDV